MTTIQQSHEAMQACRLHRGPAPYPRNTWYVAATSVEVGREILARTILGEPVIMYRTEAGEAVALRGLCPHRMMPLSEGEIVGDKVQCPYHGFQFTADGECVLAPAVGRPVAAARLRRYPVVEKGPLIWIWMGDAERADSDRLPKVDEIGLGDGPNSFRAAVAEKPMRMAARYSLLLDNLMDLSHLAFLHAGSVGEAKFALAEPRLDKQPDRVRYGREVVVPPNPITQQLVPGIEGMLKLEFFSDYYGPSIINASGPWIADPESSPTRYYARLNFIHIFTPETPTSTHYFTGISHDYRVDEPDFTAMWIERMTRVVKEDIDALQQIERQIELYGDDFNEISIKSDAGGILVRRQVQEMIAEEQHQAEPA